MKIQFNEAQLSRPQRESLMNLLEVMQSENQNELVITEVEFPIKLKVNLDNDIEMMLGWNVDKQCYDGFLMPEPIPESEKDTVDLPAQEHGTLEVDLPGKKSEPELDLSPVIVHAEALARALVDLSKPLNIEQRIEVWCKFCLVLSKELWK